MVFEEVMIQIGVQLNLCPKSQLWKAEDAKSQSQKAAKSHKAKNELVMQRMRKAKAAKAA